MNRCLTFYGLVVDNCNQSLFFHFWLNLHKPSPTKHACLDGCEEAGLKSIENKSQKQVKTKIHMDYTTLDLYCVPWG